MWLGDNPLGKIGGRGFSHGVLNWVGVKTAVMTDHPVPLIQYLPLAWALA